jgi:hypothetical protein
MQILLLVVLVLGGLGSAQASVPPGTAPAKDLHPPIAVTVDGVPLDLATDARSKGRGGNPYPWFGDFDGDGKPDLLVGQAGRGKSGEGHLRIYRDLGGQGGPRLAAPVWFDDAVPTGRIPSG